MIGLVIGVAGLSEIVLQSTVPLTFVVGMES